MRFSNKSEIKRLFIGIPLTPDKQGVDMFNAIKKKLAKEKISWTRPEQWHVTLHFFGETPISKIDSIIKCINESLSNFFTHEVFLQQLGFFGHKTTPRVLWWDIHPAEELINLQQKLATQLSRKHFPLDSKPFKPHLTIGRVKSLHDTSLFQELIEQNKSTVFFKTVIANIVLYESILSSIGPTYIPLFTYHLRK